MFYTLDGAMEQVSRFLPLEGREDQAAPPEPTRELLLEADRLCKTFGDGFNALIDVSARFGRGRVVSILGQNGSGKTTLVKHLNGLYRPPSGAVRDRGGDLAGRSVADISHDVILGFQHPEHMLFEETVLGELTFCARMQGRSFSQEEAMEILREYGLDADAEELPVNLSMGKKHILTILSVLFSGARVVISTNLRWAMDRFLKDKLLPNYRQTHRGGPHGDHDQPRNPHDLRHYRRRAALWARAACCSRAPRAALCKEATCSAP
jgi:energy-coupling factor transport system ATP-binding protein